MKSLDLQKVVLSKCRNGDNPSSIYRDLNRTVGLTTINRWCKMIAKKGAIELRHSPGRPRTVRTKETIRMVKRSLKRKKKPTIRKLAREIDIKKGSMHRILKNDLGCRPYKKRIEPLLTDGQKAKRIRFSNWIRNNYRKEDTLRILFSDEKMFDIDGLYNAQNDRVWAVNRAEADASGGVKQKRKFPQKIMVWLGACTKGVTPLVILDGNVDHRVYIKKVLPVARKFGNECFGDRWTFQQDGARAHTHHLSQDWCTDHFPSIIDKEHWPPNSPDLNPLDYFVWDEFVHQMNWKNVRSKKSLIAELKRAVKRIRLDKLLESCKSWSNRLYRMCKIGGNYLAK